MIGPPPTRWCRRCWTEGAERSSAAAAAFRLSAVEAVEQARGHPRADEMRDVAAERADLLHETRGDELKTVGGHQKHGLDPGIEPGVHAGHLELVFEIRHGP